MKYAIIFLCLTFCHTDEEPIPEPVKPQPKLTLCIWEQGLQPPIGHGDRFIKCVDVSDGYKYTDVKKWKIVEAYDCDCR